MRISLQTFSVTGKERSEPIAGSVATAEALVVHKLSFAKDYAGLQ